jgi:hypothetical protein
MTFNQAKEIKRKFINYLLCHTYAFIAPSEPELLKKYLDVANNYPKGPGYMYGLLANDSIVKDILNEKFPKVDLDIYIATKDSTGVFQPEPIREHIRNEEIDFDINKYL